jgi:hypothetical protein
VVIGEVRKVVHERAWRLRDSVLLLAHKIHGRVGPRRGNARRSGSWKSARGIRIGGQKSGKRTYASRTSRTDRSRAAAPPPGHRWAAPGTGPATRVIAPEHRFSARHRRQVRKNPGRQSKPVDTCTETTVRCTGAARDPHRALRCRHEAARSTLEACAKSTVRWANAQASRQVRHDSRASGDAARTGGSTPRARAALRTARSSTHARPRVGRVTAAGAPVGHTMTCAGEQETCCARQQNRSSVGLVRAAAARRARRTRPSAARRKDRRA